jgi:predicted AAA+ superfamily ATPase
MSASLEMDALEEQEHFVQETVEHEHSHQEQDWQAQYAAQLQQQQQQESMSPTARKMLVYVAVFVGNDPTFLLCLMFVHSLMFDTQMAAFL